MKREIKFRGKDIENENGWRYGSLVVYPDGNCVIVEFDKDENELSYDVQPETVGQFTGLYDKNGKEIYDGDICRTKEGYFIVKWHNKACAFMAYNLKSYAPFSWFSNVETTGIEVVGNVHDNPELLKEK